MTEYVTLVNDKNEVIGLAEKIIAHKKALLHRAFSIFILREKEYTFECLLQQRAKEKYHCPLLWTNTCCGHPRPGEDTRTAAERRLDEEMNLQIALQPIGVFQYNAPFENGLTENEIDHVFIGYFEDTPLIPNPKEAADTRWVTLDALENQIANTPEEFTPWLSQALAIVREHLKR